MKKPRIIPAVAGLTIKPATKPRRNTAIAIRRQVKAWRKTAQQQTQRKGFT
jgi:hypothetical protein